MMGAGRSFANPGTLGTDLTLAAWDRLEDARALVSAGRSAMAIALGLYALEIQLKVLICEHLEITHLPKPFEIHDLDQLLILCGLSRQIDQSSLSLVRLNWENVLGISTKLNELRYSPEDRWPIQQAHDFLGWLDDPTHGVMTWLATR